MHSCCREVRDSLIEGGGGEREEFICADLLKVNSFP